MKSSKLLDTQVFKSIIQVYILEIAETIVINFFCGFSRVLFLFTISYIQLSFDQKQFQLPGSLNISCLGVKLSKICRGRLLVCINARV